MLNSDEHEKSFITSGPGRRKPLNKGQFTSIDMGYKTETGSADFLMSTVELQWLEAFRLVYYGCFELLLESLGKIPIAADLE